MDILWDECAIVIVKNTKLLKDVSCPHTPKLMIMIMQ